MPRFGIEFAIPKTYSRFSFVGFGPTESYIDKHAACDYGYCESDSDRNYESGYDSLEAIIASAELAQEPPQRL